MSGPESATVRIECGSNRFLASGTTGSSQRAYTSNTHPERRTCGPRGVSFDKSQRQNRQRVGNKCFATRIAYSGGTFWPPSDMRETSVRWLLLPAFSAGKPNGVGADRPADQFHLRNASERNAFVGKKKRNQRRLRYRKAISNCRTKTTPSHRAIQSRSALENTQGSPLGSASPGERQSLCSPRPVEQTK